MNDFFSLFIRRRYTVGRSVSNCMCSRVYAKYRVAGIFLLDVCERARSVEWIEMWNEQSAIRRRHTVTQNSQCREAKRWERIIQEEKTSSHIPSLLWYNHRSNTKCRKQHRHTRSLAISFGHALNGVYLDGCANVRSSLSPRTSFVAFCIGSPFHWTYPSWQRLFSVFFFQF